MGEFVAETCRADLKTSINGICYVLLVAYIVLLMMHGATNIKFMNSMHLCVHVFRTRKGQYGSYHICGPEALCS